MKKIYAYEWFGIKFNDFTKPSFNTIADSTFYEKFYREFFRCFKSYLDLPESYRKSKGEIANFLFSKVNDKSRILSIGCGNGYIEHRLAMLITEKEAGCSGYNVNIIAIEPSIAASQWVNSDNVTLLQGFFPDILEPDECFDIVYSSVIDYVFNDKEYLAFLKSVADFGIKDFFLTDIILPPHTPIIETIKGIMKDLLSMMGLYESRQFWGYLRTIDEHKNMLKRAGFVRIEVGNFSHGTYWIRASCD